MAKLTAVVNRRSGHAFTTKSKATLVGGPELSQALRRLDDAVRVQVAKDAVMAMGEPLRESWQAGLPIGPEPYHLEDAIKVKASKTKSGASGSVAPRRVSGAQSDEQPGLYARKLEYGSRDTAAQPAARPAFDQRKQEAVDAAERVLRDAVERIARSAS